MATIKPTVTRLEGESALVRITWASMANGDVGAPVAKAQYADRSVQVVGTFGAAGSVRWEGSNDETNFAVLTDSQGNNLDFTANKIEAVTEITAVARPRVTAGDGTTSLTVTLLARCAQPLRV